MSQGNNKRLAKSMDAMLAEWPIEERSSLEWEQSAADIEARIRRGVKADETSEMSTYITDEEIFSPPAGQNEKDGHNSGSQRPEAGRVSKAAPVPKKLMAEEPKMSLTNEQRERDRKSLQDLARMAALTPQPASVRNVPVATPSKPTPSSDVMLPSTRAEDSGLVNLAALTPPPPSAQPVSSEPPMSMRPDQVRESVSRLPISPRPSTPAQAGLFDEEPASARPESVHPVAGPPASVGGQLVATLPSGAVPQVGHQSQPPFAAHQSQPPFAVHQSQPPVAVQAVPSQRAQELVSKADKASTKKGGGAAIYVIGTFVALAAVAAGGFLVVKPRLIKAQQAPVAAAVKVDEKPAASEVPTTRWQDQIAQNSAPATATAEDTTAPNDMEIATPQASKAAPASPKKGGVVAKKSGKDELALAPAPPPPAPATPTPKVDSKDGTVASDDALGKAMKTAAGPVNSGDMTTPDEKKPAYAAGSVPQRPSQGAVIGALGAVMQNARACLDADDAVSRATVTFASDGTVKNVGINGGAKGKPAEACIKGALSHAKVSPFAEESYTTTVTVRH